MTYVIESVKVRGQFLSIEKRVSELGNGTNVRLWGDAESAYAQWQLEFADGI